MINGTNAINQTLQSKCNDEAWDIGANSENAHQNENKDEISNLLKRMIELQIESTTLETAIRQQGREIKMDIFPEGYDKRAAPPRANGRSKSTHFEI